MVSVLHCIFQGVPPSLQMKAEQDILPSHHCLAPSSSPWQYNGTQGSVCGFYVAGGGEPKSIATAGGRSEERAS